MSYFNNLLNSYNTVNQGLGNTMQTIGQTQLDFMADPLSYMQSGYNALTGQKDPNAMQFTQWQNQGFNPAWNTSYTRYTPAVADATSVNYNVGDQFQSILGQAMDTSQQFLDPTSDYYKTQRGILGEQTGQLAGQTTAQQDAMLASRGVGSGAIRNIMGNQAQSTAGQDVRTGLTQMQNQGAGLGLQALGQAGQMSGQQEQMMLQQALANQNAQNQFALANMQSQNQANQFNTQNQLQNQQWNLGNQMNWAGNQQANQFAANQFNASQWNQNLLQNAQNQANFYNNLIGGTMNLVGSGFSAGSSVASAMAPAMMAASDIRLKENIKKVGKLDNGLPVYSFNYINDSMPMIGLMAQDVEKVHPDAVKEINGYKHVNYNKAIEEVV